MAVLDGGHVAVAHIISRGNRLAMSGCLSVSVFGPDPAYAMCPPLSLEQQLWQAHCMSGTDLHNSTPIHSAGPLSGPGSVQYLNVPSAAPPGAAMSPFGSPSPAWATPVIGPPHASSFTASPAQEQWVSSITHPGALSCSSPTWAPCADLQQQQAAGMPLPARRSLSVALSSSSSADAEECSTPRGQMIPAELPAPDAPRAPRPTARLLMPRESHSRLQQWLNGMELKLAVPAGPSAPGSHHFEGPPQAPKATSGTYAARRPALTVKEVRNAPGALTGPFSSTSSGAAAAPGKCAAPAASAAHNAAAGQLGSSSSSPGARKRGMQDGPALSLRVPAPADSCASCSAGGNSSQCWAGTAAGSARSSKRRSVDGAGSSGSAAPGTQHTVATAAAGSETSVSAADLPAPAFDLLGLLSTRR
jgi:hypothetical protein